MNELIRHAFMFHFNIYTLTHYSHTLSLFLYLGKSYAINMEVKKKNVCPECLHPHRQGKFCHVFAMGRTDIGAMAEDGKYVLFIYLSISFYCEIF